jgi:hypothetical protein
MSWSDKISFYESLKARGKLKPEDLMPEISDGDGLLMGLFYELSSARQIGMGIGPIPATVYWEAQKRYGLTEEALLTLQLLDREFVKQNASNS